ncbi:hypothetical protein [Hansschlegelia plantiphila]|uniref:Uncharacterized protein n=1 Tax=Hansschlegelia plantiphila TaxID=374655 RepID=A0A9W6J2B7_9HYPH|nr:hypothetical protein [Hansschlegelia plantiphila]GLK69541.1 hypothetical protein GCM10008179_31790 [Hansschlegelia plantiphila]
MNTTWRWAAAILVAAAATTEASAAAPGDRQFITIESHDPSAFLRAVRVGADFVKSGRGRQFRIILANGGVIVAIPGMALVQRDLPPILRGASGLGVVACKETIDLLSKANKRRVPVLPGVQVASCRSLRHQMTVAGWQTAPGLDN